MNRNYHASVGSSVRRSTKSWMNTALLVTVVLAMAGVAFWLAGTRHFATKAAHNQISASSLSLPLYFEPNQGQTDPQVKFLARGAGYGLFLTANEAVLDLQHPAAKGQPAGGNVIRMHFDGASSTPHIQGTKPLPGKSSYFIGNDSAKWHRNIPQFGRIEYQNIYPGIDLVYYGEQRQLEYDFHIAPGADANQIALSFQGAFARLDSGDLVLSTTGGDVCFHAPHIYQFNANRQKDIPGGFRLLANNKIGFAVGPYDHSRELVIDPLLTYSTFLGSGVPPLPQVVQVAVDTANNIYVAGSTTSANFPTTSGAYQSSLAGAQNVFIAVLNTSLSNQLVYATYLGGSGTDTLAGVAVDVNFNIYVAGSTTSTNFPTTSSAFQPPSSVTFNGNQHGFVTRLSYSSGTYSLGYSTYLAGSQPANNTDIVTGLAIDANGNAYVTGTTTSTNDQSNGFPSNSYAFQPCPFAPPQTGVGCTVTSGPPQFFASKISTTLAGFSSMIYSTYFGGGNGTTAVGGGAAVDASGNMYFTGATNMQNYTAAGSPAAFPIVNAVQPCLDQPTITSCALLPNPANTDAILVKLSPSQASGGGAPPFFSTYLGGSLNDVGIAVALDSSTNVYVTGSTNSPDWNCVSPCTAGPIPPFGYNGAGANNAFLAKITNQTQGSTVYPLSYFAWLGGSGTNGQGDSGQAIAVDSVGTIHVAGTTYSSDLPITNPLSQGGSYGGNGDAFVALVAPSTVTTGNYITYLGGSGTDQGTGLAIDTSNNTYVGGTTTSGNFPVTNGSTLSSAPPDAFATKIGSNSNITVSTTSGSPYPSPVAAGQQAAFTFDIVNNGPDPATNINFYAVVPTGFQITPTAKIDSGIGTCALLAPGSNTIPCLISTLAAGATAEVEVDITPPAPPPPGAVISVSCSFSANAQPVQSCPQSQSDNIVDFTISASPSTLTINAGDTASFPITLTPNPTYNSNITMGETSAPSIVTSTTPTFTVPVVSLTGSSAAMTTLNIPTVPRPVNTGRLLRRTSFYATWLPIGGLSLAGLGIGAGCKHRRWLIGALLGLIAGLFLLQPACGQNSSSVTTNQGTAAGKYTITVTGSASTTASHQILLTLYVN